MTDTNQKTFSLTRQENGIAHLVMDVAGETMNTLKSEFADEINHGMTTEYFKYMES